MNLFEQQLSKSAPTVLFHYTTQTGLLGILQSRELWATMSGYLNDSSEFELARSIAHEVVGGRIAASRDSVESRLLDDMKQSIDHAGANVGVLCLSEACDSLSQWRAYGESGSGYAIGFDAATLGEIAAKSGYILTRSLYQPDEQREVFNLLVEQTLQENLVALAEGKYGEDEKHNGRNFVFYLNRYALAFKDSAFQEEQEWRLMSRPISVRTAGFDFRAGRASLVPFHRIPISYEQDDLPISNIVVGPMATPKLAEAAIRGLLIKQSLKLKRVRVGRSVIPYRG